MIHDGQFDLHVRLIYVYMCVTELLTIATFAMLISGPSKLALCGPLQMFLLDMLPTELEVRSLGSQ